MVLPENRRLKSAANESIMRAACDARKLVVFHTAVILVLSLAALAIDFVLEQKIGNTGGLSGVGLRSVLETVQTVLRQAQGIALPFWQIGWLYATVKIARGETADKTDLLEGFRKFFPVLRLKVLKALILIGAIFAAAYVSSYIVMMTPWANSMMDMMTAGIESITQAELIAQITQAMIPMMIITAVLTLIAYAPFFYWFRLAEFALLDNPQQGARAALGSSRRLMRGNMWKLLRLDLSFWWFWLMTLVISALGWADVLLPLMGVELPWTAEISYFVAYLLAAVAQLALYYFCKAKVDVTYAHAYLSLSEEENVYESH